MPMRIVYAGMDLHLDEITRRPGRRHVPPAKQSIFLAGPTPRSPDVRSWRPRALELLLRKGFVGTVLVPEPRDGVFGRKFSEKTIEGIRAYDHQFTWEFVGLGRATCIMFWIPRGPSLPGFTTNVEFGYWARAQSMGPPRQRIVAGAPERATHTRYLQVLSGKLGIHWCSKLEDVVDLAMIQAATIHNDGINKSEDD